MYLAADIGGTKTVMGLFDPAGDQLNLVAESTYPSHDFKRFDDILIDFLKSRTGPLLTAACFGVAGTVVNGRCQTTNLPWVLDERDSLRSAAVEILFENVDALEFESFVPITSPPVLLRVSHDSHPPTPNPPPHSPAP